MVTIEQLTEAMLDVVKADNDRIPTPSRYVIQAITQVYSFDVPREIVTDVDGDGSSYLPTPTADDATFEEAFSEIKSVEYPINDDDPVFLEDGDFLLRKRPSGLSIFARGLKFTQPARVIWIARHKDDASTVPDSDFYAIVDVAGALYMEAIAAKYIELGSSTFNSDVVDYRTKGQEALNVAKTLRRRYRELLGLNDGDNGQSQPAPAFAHADFDNVLGNGQDRLLHGRRTR